jgi:hypothetical protein
MRILPAALPLLLASCMMPTSPGAGTTSPSAAPNVSEQAAQLKADAQRQVNTATGSGGPTAPGAAAEATGIAPNVSIDRNRRLETVDVFTDLMDPGTSKNLVSFLMRPDEWLVVRVDMPSPTTRWWRFQRVARTDGKSMPDVDPLRRR